jgi:hypothetical protein
MALKQIEAGQGLDRQTTSHPRACLDLVVDKTAYLLWVLNTVNLSRERLTVFSTHLDDMLFHLGGLRTIKTAEGLVDAGISPDGKNATGS